MSTTISDDLVAKINPMPGVVKPSDERLSELSRRAPTLLLEMFSKLGFGCYCNGFLRFCDPADLDETLAEWLEGYDAAKIPIATTALGDLLYFRDLREPAPRGPGSLSRAPRGRGPTCVGSPSARVGLTIPPPLLPPTVFLICFCLEPSFYFPIGSYN